MATYAKAQIKRQCMALELLTASKQYSDLTHYVLIDLLAKHKPMSKYAGQPDSIIFNVACH